MTVAEKGKEKGFALIKGRYLFKLRSRANRLDFAAKDLNCVLDLTLRLLKQKRFGKHRWRWKTFFLQETEPEGAHAFKRRSTAGLATNSLLVMNNFCQKIKSLPGGQPDDPRSCPIVGPGVH